MLPKKLLLCVIYLTFVGGHASLFDSIKDFDMNKIVEKATDEFGDTFNGLAEETGDKLGGMRDRMGDITGALRNKLGGVRDKVGDQLGGIGGKVGETLGDVSDNFGNRVQDAKKSIGGIISDLGNLTPDGPLVATPTLTEDDDDMEARSARRNKLPIQRVFDLNEYSPPWTKASPADLQDTPTTALWLQFAVTNVTDTLLRDLKTPNWAGMFKALGPEKEILKRYASISNRFETLEAQTTDTFDILKNLSEQLGLNSTWSLIWDEMEADIVSVAALYKWFEKYQNNMAVVNERTLIDYAETVQGDERTALPSMLAALHSNARGDCSAIVKENVATVDQTVKKLTATLTDAVEDLLAGIEDQMVDVEEKAPVQHSEKEVKLTGIKCEEAAFGALKALATEKVYEGELCTLTKSPQQLVFDLYNLLALTDAKGYAMMQFSWMLLRLADKGNFSRESDLARIDFEKRVVEKAEVARRVISELPTWYDRCVSSNHTENETYHQFTEFLQGYVVNEVDLNTDNTCKEECKSYTVAQEQGCHKKTFCNAEKRCELGKLYSCTFFEADSSVCLSKDKNRRYDWIEYKSGRVVGQKSTCEKGKTARADSWWRFLYHCSNCICLCDQPGPRSDRYISLKPATANILAGNIVTGVKFVKQGRVVHIQIQEGKALARGAVNASSLQWRPVERIIPDESRTALINKYSDYAVLSWLERAIDLDHLVAPEGHVLTGLRFRRLGVHINLEIQVAPIQFSTGWIDFAGAIWMGSESTTASDKPRKIIPLTNADTPLRSPTRPMQDSGDNQYVEFQATSIDKDVGQTTIPFLDAQPVTPQPPMWLTGVGLVHKGSSGYGGFLSLKVATYDMTKHILAPSVVTPPKLEENPIQDNEHLN